MAAISGLLWARLRRRAMAMLPLMLVVAAGTTGMLVAFGVAQRTSTAYDRYSTRADVGDLQINPSLPSKEIDTLIRSLPGVVRVTTHDLLGATGGPKADHGTALEATAAEVRGSVDGRFVDMDRPAVRSGRLPTGRREVFLNKEMADFYHLRVGSVVPTSFAPSAPQLDGYEPPRGAPPPKETAVVLRVVGIGTFADEALPDGLYPRQRAVVSRDVAKRYDCKTRPLHADDSLAEAIDAVFPDGCSVNYRYYSLSIRGGDRGVRVAQEAFVRGGTQLSRSLPKSLRDQGLGYELIPRLTARDRERVDHATRPTVAALTVLGLAVGLVTVLTVVIVIGREARRSTADQRQWWQLGVTLAQRATLVAAPLLAAVAIGVAAALPAAFVLSPLGPVGNVRDVEPSPSHTLSSWAWLAALVAGVVMLAASAVLAWVACRRVSRPVAARPVGSVVDRLTERSSRPGVAAGVRAAFARDRGAGFVAAGGALAFGVLLTAMVFGTSLTNLVRTPPAYGWPWDVAVITNFGYGGGLQTRTIDADLARRPDVAGWSTLAFSSSLAVDGDPLPSIIVVGDHLDRDDIAVERGRLPTGDGEVVLGTRTAAAHHVSVGDTVSISGRAVTRNTARVTGLAVLPSVGPFESDRPSPGEGMLLPASMIERAYADQLAAFVGIKLAPGHDPDIALASIRRSYKAWGVNEYRVDTARPVRPAEIVDAAGVRTIPLLVGGLLGLSLVVGLGIVVTASVRARRRELAILRTLGFTGRQLRASVRVQAAVMMLAALVVGVPLGIAVGRAAWRAFADGIAVGLAPATPRVGVLAATAVGSLVAVLAVATLPAIMAARAHPAVMLRSE